MTTKRSNRPRSRRKKTRGVSLFWIVTGAVMAPIVALVGWSLLPGPGGGARVIVDIPEGASTSSVARLLSDAGAIRSPGLFTVFVSLWHSRTPIAPGPHVLNDGLSPRSLFNRLSRSGARPTQKSTIVEGLDHIEIASRLEELEVCPAREFRRAVRDPALLSELGISGESAEGLLFPATYELIVDSTPENVVRALVKTTRERLSAFRAAHAPAVDGLNKRGFGEREILTLASIVEKEAQNPEERATIASVYFNRLESAEFKPEKMLQADPTAAYGCRLEPEKAASCRGYSGKVTPAMLRDEKNRYNTYKHPGLPPGPIANPGSAAILAVIEPAKTDYLFFVAVGGGRHKFSRTLDEHNRAIETRR